MERALPERGDLDKEITWHPAFPPPATPQPLGAGYLILVARELTGRSQRSLARHVGTSQSTIATLESGNRLPTIRTLLRVTRATDLELVLGLRHPRLPKPDHRMLGDLGFALLGTLHPNAEDGLADLVVLREPTPFEGPG